MDDIKMSLDVADAINTKLLTKMGIVLDFEHCSLSIPVKKIPDG